MTQLHPDAIQSLVNGEHGAPFEILGSHVEKDAHLTIRTFQPNVKAVQIDFNKKRKKIRMKKIHDAGLYEAIFECDDPKIAYRFDITTHDGEHLLRHDPYAFPTQLSDFDLHLFGEGRHWNIYEKLGAHPTVVNGVEGIHFAVWAPNANRVSIIGNFNAWDDRTHPMGQRNKSGIWELFIPEMSVGELYKYAIRSHNQGHHIEKTDPYGFQAEMRPKTASVTADLSTYEWHDDKWMNTRSAQNPLEEPMSIYEVHLGSWKRKNGYEWLTYHEFADELVHYVKSMNYTHVELLPVSEHPLDASWGYQVTGYFAPTSRFGTPDEFMYLVDKFHQNNIGVILDWVPAHFPKDGHGLNYFDGTHLYAHADPRQGEHPDWGTMIFNYARNEVRNFLISNALFWLEKYHIDGLRVDAVSSMIYLDFSREDGQWIPNEYGGNENIPAIQFLRELNEVVHEKHQGVVMVAEESTAWGGVSRPTYTGGLGFTFKWNMGWMHDTLDYISLNAVHRSYHHHQMTFSLLYAFSENFVLSLSHDEVVHGKGSLINKIPGDWWQQFATMRLLFGYQATHPGKILNFMGQEFGQRNEWNENVSLDWHLLDMPPHRDLSNWVRDLNALYRNEPALYEQDFSADGFEWIEADDTNQSVFTYIRYAKNRDDFVIVACNFTPVPRYGYRIGVPKQGFYQELLNSDADVYGGGNIGNHGGVYSEPIYSHQRDESISLNVPPLSILILKHTDL